MDRDQTHEAFKRDCDSNSKHCSQHSSKPFTKIISPGLRAFQQGRDTCQLLFYRGWGKLRHREKKGLLEFIDLVTGEALCLLHHIYENSLWKVVYAKAQRVIAPSLHPLEVGRVFVLSGQLLDKETTAQSCKQHQSFSSFHVLAD